MKFLQEEPRGIIVQRMAVKQILIFWEIKTPFSNEKKLQKSIMNGRGVLFCDGKSEFKMVAEDR